MRSALRAGLSVLLIACCLALSLIGAFFLRLSGGGLKMREDPVVFCRDVPSSAAEADLSVQFLAVMLLPALIRLFRFRREFGVVEILLVPVMLPLVVGLLATAECGDLSRAPILYQVINVSLATYPIAAFLLVFVRWPKLILP